jgi:hypothetical protein
MVQEEMDALASGDGSTALLPQMKKRKANKMTYCNICISMNKWMIDWNS